MKKLSFAILIFIFLWISFPQTSFAACFSDTNYSGQCGPLGDCDFGSQCQYDIKGNYFCSTDSSCPNNQIVCGQNSNTVNSCGFSAGCRYGEKCMQGIKGYTCVKDSSCPAAPDSCPSNSASECVVSVGGTNVGVDTGTACGSTAGYTCQHQGAPNADSQKCVCQLTATPTPSVSPTTTITPSITPLPTLPPIESTGQSCSSLGKNTIYPPNSACYSEVKQVESDISQYPLSCIPAPEVKYDETRTIRSSVQPPSQVSVTAVSDISNASLGFLGPDSNTLSSLNSDDIARTYLFNGLFDRPSYSQENMPREIFRTYWRMLSSNAQANLKAIYLQASHTNDTKLFYYYLDSNNNKKETDTQILYQDLPDCLRKYPVCLDYVKRYQSLSTDLKTRYDTLLPFDFNNNRSYITLNGSISKESIPYLKAIISALEGSFSFSSLYSPSWLIQSITNPSTISVSSESTLYSAIKNNLISSCATPSKMVSSTSPKTYPDNPSFTQTINVPLQSEAIKSTPDSCVCSNPSNPNCDSCTYYSSDQHTCQIIGCSFSPGETTYKLTGTATGNFATVLNNPLISTLNNILVGKTGAQGENSFYRMLTPWYAPAVEKTIISAPSSKVTTPTEYASVSKNSNASIYRENGLAQTAVQSLQNCWLVPSDQQSAMNCGTVSKIPVGECALSEEPLTGSCSKDKFAAFAAQYQAQGYGAPLSSFIPLVTPELSAVYAEAEKQTGVSCVILAAVHYMEGGSNPCLSLISGRKLGTPEPDKGGKTYSTLLETAIDAGNELAYKGAASNNFQDVITALSYYNGGGNSNCRIDWSKHSDISPQYLYCPHDFDGEDDPYATSLLGEKHAHMYLRCLRDHDCSSVVAFTRPGAFTVALNYYNSLP